MRVLIVDDSRAMRALIGRALKELQMETMEAVNGREAMEKLRGGEKADVALVDWNMPEMNGLEFVRAVRACNFLDEMRIIMVTTEAELERMSEALACGANEYLMKPFTKDGMAEKLKMIGCLAG